MLKRNSLWNSIGGMLGVTVFSQLVAFVRESVFAYYYGVGCETDAYIMASQIPIILFAVVGTAINTVLLPIYTEQKEKTGKDGANSFLKSFSIIFIIVMLVVISSVEFMADIVVKIFAPHFSGELLALTIQYTRILFPTVILTGIINIYTASYNANNQFLFPLSAALLQNITLIVSMVVFSGRIGAWAAIWGTVLGIVLNMLVIAAFKIEILKVDIDIGSTWQNIKKALYRVVPITLGVGIAEINRIIDKAIASGLAEGSISALNYANKLTTVLASLILSAVSSVAFKQFTEDYVKQDNENRNCTLNQYLSILIAILCPITIGAIILKKEIIIMAFGRGAFGEKAVIQTVEVFQYYILGIVFIAVREILSKFIYSTGDTKTPMINSGISVIINLILNIVLSKYLKAGGLALATTISGIVACVLLLISVWKKEEFFSLANLRRNLVFIAVASLGMTIVLLYVNYIVGFQYYILKMLFNLIIGATVYFLILLLISKTLIRDILQTLFQRF